MNRLSASTLAEIRGADVPGYDRSQPATIVHLGVGAFARAHVATYADDLLRAGWPAVIRGVSLRSARAEAALAPQDGLFSVTTREPSAVPSTLVVGSVASVTTGVDAAMEAVADPEVGLVTLTVTEKGYELNGRNSVPAMLAAALGARRVRTNEQLVVASLDNLLDNGTLLRRRVLHAAEALDGGLASWIADRVAFPRSVVDRMVPATTGRDLEQIAARLGVIDDAAVVGEAHRSWVVEKVDGLPPLERVGVDVVADITPYQHRKLWLLNGPHSAVAYAGLLTGHETIAEGIADPVVAGFVRRLVDDVLAVAPLPGVDPGLFAEASIRRFANAALGHTCAQVAADGSRKLPQRLLPVMDLRAKAGRSTMTLATVVAIWLASVTGAPVCGVALPSIDDPARSELERAMQRRGAAGALEVVGDGFVTHVEAVQRASERVARLGVGALEVDP